MKQKQDLSIYMDLQLNVIEFFLLNQDNSIRAKLCVFTKICLQDSNIWKAILVVF